MHCWRDHTILLLCFLLWACDKEEPAGPSMELTPVMNLLENGNCEEWYDAGGGYYYLYGWSMREHYGSVTKESDNVYEGEYSVRMSSPKKGLIAKVSQKVEVVPGHDIRIRFYYYVEEPCTGTEPRMYCYFRDSSSDNISNDALADFYDEATLGIIRGGGYGLSSFPLNYNEWQLFDYIIQVPARARHFVFEIHSYAGTTMYVDDCWVVDVDMYN